MSCEYLVILTCVRVDRGCLCNGRELRIPVVVVSKLTLVTVTFVLVILITHVCTKTEKLKHYPTLIKQTALHLISHESLSRS